MSATTTPPSTAEDAGSPAVDTGGGRVSRGEKHHQDAWGEAGAESDAAAAELQRLRHEVAGLRVAMETRAGIEQAKGVLVARYGCTPEAAFAVLVRWSSHANLKLRVMAEALVATSQEGAPAGTVDPQLARWIDRQLGASEPVSRLRAFDSASSTRNGNGLVPAPSGEVEPSPSRRV